MLAILVPVVSSVNESRSKVLSLFCEIEDSAVQKLAFKCDRFLMKVQSEDDADDMDSNNDELMFMMGESGNFRRSKRDVEEEYGVSTSGGQDRKKGAKHLTKTNLFFYLKFMAGIAVIEAYYSYNFSSVKDFASTTLV